METRSYTPPFEGEIAMDTLMLSAVPVAYKIPGLMGGGFSYTTGAEAENSPTNL